MFVHLGNDVMADIKNIIGVLDIEKITAPKTTRNFLSAAGKLGRVVYCSYEMPKSFIVCLDENLTETVYISQLAPATICKRIRNITIGKFD